MPRKTVVPDLDQFRPPGFRLKRYNTELKPRTPEEWHHAMRKRSRVLSSIDEWSYPERGGNRDRAEEFCRRELPEVFGEHEQRRDAPISAYEKILEDLRSHFNTTEDNYSRFVTDLSTGNALVIVEAMLKNEEFVRTIEYREAGNLDWLYDSEKAGTVSVSKFAVPVLQILESSGYLGSTLVPVQVDLRGPDLEIIDGFKRWLASARNAYGMPQPRPEVLKKKHQNPVITQAMLDDWQRDQILPFLDLYLWNRLYNPPPREGLWKATNHGRFSHLGASWTLTAKTWLKLLEWDDDRTFRRDILGKAFHLLDGRIVNLLGAFARRNPQPPLSES